jgi:pimeloyl-ACP methyl ester carboxylesterase
MTKSPVLCLLPGLLCDATVWESQTAALAGAAEIHVPDFWGLSSFEDMALKVLDETTSALAVAGHSMGGHVALEMWRLAPERIERLALLDTGFHGPRPQESGARMDLVDLAYRDGMAAVAARWLPPMLHPGRVDEPGLLAPLTQMVCRATPQIFEGQQRAGLTRRDATGCLPGIACPTLVLCGRQDSWSPLPQHEQMAAAIPGARLRIVEDCGHMSTVERPDAVTAALRTWLDLPALERAEGRLPLVAMS